MDGDSPAVEPKNCSSTGTKSPVDSPCRYSSGSISEIFGVLRTHGGRIAEENRLRAPISFFALDQNRSKNLANPCTHLRIFL